MKHLYNRNQLVEYGINPLTGESCAYSMRVLCDLSQKGVNLIASFLGLRYDALNGDGFQMNWNSKVGPDDAIRSFMLPHGLLSDLYKYILYHVERCDVIVASKDGSMIGLKRSDRYYAQYVEMAREPGSAYDLYHNPIDPTRSAGGRNEHQMSGRTV